MPARPRGRALGAALALALTFVVGVFATPTAHARVHAVIPADSNGPNDYFETNQNLWATGTANPLEGSNQLCVVEMSGPQDNCLTDGIWGQPNVIAVTGTYLQPIVAAPLPTGTYRILGDNGDDGQDILSEPFTVGPCTADDCSSRLADAELKPWKDAAREAQKGPGAACLAMMVHGIDAATVAAAATSKDLRSFIVGQLNDTAAVELDFTAPTSTQELAMGALRHVSCGAYLAYGDIVADPPDPDYEHVAEPRVEDVPSAGAGSATEAAAAMERLRANAVAQRIASERHQGAAADGDQGWASFHATTVAETGFAAGREARRAVAPLRAAALELDGDMSIHPATAEAVEQARDVHARIAATGFTAGELADLEALGVPPSELPALRAEMGRPLPPGTGGVHPADALRAEADALAAASCHAEGSSCAFDEFARLAGAVGGNTAVAPRLEIPDVTLREGDRGRNHVTFPVRLSHPANEPITATMSGELPEGVERANFGVVNFAAHDLRGVGGFEVANDDTAGPDRTAQISTSVAGPAAAPDPFTLTVQDDDDAPAPRPGRKGRLAFSTGSGPATTFIAEPSGSDVEPVYESPGSDRLHPVSWSSDGRFLLMHRFTLTGSDDAAGGRPYFALPVGKDGRPAGDKVRLTPPGNGLYEGASWSRDGKSLAYVTYRGLTWSLSLQRLGADGAPAGEMIDLSQDPDLAGMAWFDGTSWAPDGRRLAIAACESGYEFCGIYVVDVDDGGVTGAPRPVIRRRYGGVGEDADLPSWSPDGRFLAYRRREADGTEVVERVAVDAAGTPQGAPVTLTTQRLPELPITWAPDSRAIAFASPQHPLSDGWVNSGVVRDMDASGHPVGEPRPVLPLGLNSSTLSWGPPVLDADQPVTTATLAQPANERGWHRQPVVVRLRADDADGDGVASITHSVDGTRSRATTAGAAADVTISADGVHRLSYFATDKAGNAETPRTLVVRVDRTAPNIAISSPGAGTAQTIGTALTAGYACTDGASGVLACEGSTPAGAALDTSSLGARTLRVTARDRAGNVTTADRAWSVVPAASPAPAPPTQPPPDRSSAPAAATLPSSRRCVSRRRFRIRLARLSADPLRSAEVFIGARRVRRISGRKLTAPIDLRGLPKGRFKVRVTAKTRSGRTLTTRRTYRTCVAKRRAR